MGVDFKKWIKEHNHNRINSNPVEQLSLKKTVDTAPTYIPRDASEQWVPYKNGATKGVYVFIDGSWELITV